MAQLTFDEMFSKLLSSLKSSNKVIEVSSYFGPQKDLCEMFNYIWDLDEAQKCIKILPLVYEKEDEKAENLRKEGNKFYQKKCFVKALRCYNKSIMFSPQSKGATNPMKFPNDEVEKISVLFSLEESPATKNLSLGYANRSAILFELRNYESCLLDISRSIQYGYPIQMRTKLLERQIKCYLALKDTSKAKLVLDEGLCTLQKLGINEKIILESKKNLEFLLDTFTIQNNPVTPTQDENGNGNLFGCTTPEIPKLLQPHCKIPSLSDAVLVSYSPDKGRFLTANRDIMPGETLIVERGYSCVNFPSSLLSHCSYCLLRTFTPVPCSYCPNVIFCSRDCLSKAKSFHSLECSILPRLLTLDLGKNAMLALRHVVQMPLDNLKTKVYTYEESKEQPSRLGYNENNIYSSEDYQTIFHLVTNKELRSVSDLFKRAVMAVCLVKLLLRTDYLGRPATSNYEVEDIHILENVQLIGKVLFIHLMSLPCNAHSIAELQVNSSKYQESCMEEVGCGSFAVLSLTNHSCNPSIARSCYGVTLVAKAIQFIPKGGEISDSYGEHYAILSKEERQNNLRKQYYFDCACEACSQIWPVYPKLPKNISVRCPCCSGCMALGAKQCFKCNKSSAEIQVHDGEESLNLSMLFSKIDSAYTLYNTSYKNVLEGNVSKQSYRNIISMIFYLGKYCVLPSKLMFEAQETLKHCFDRDGAHFYLQ